MKSITELKYESLLVGFDNGQVRLTDENISKILRFSGAPLGFLRCCEAKGSGTVVLYGEGQAFIIPVETSYFLDCIGEYLDINMARRRKTTMRFAGKRSNNVIFLGAGLEYIPVKVDMPWVSTKRLAILTGTRYTEGMTAGPEPWLLFRAFRFLTGSGPAGCRKSWTRAGASGKCLLNATGRFTGNGCTVKNAEFKAYVLSGIIKQRLRTKLFRFYQKRIK